MLINNTLARLLLGSINLSSIAKLGIVVQGAALASRFRDLATVIEMVIVARFRTHVTLDVAAACRCAGHLVAAKNLDKRRTT